jgi:hypothetical protein
MPDLPEKDHVFFFQRFQLFDIDNPADNICPFEGFGCRAKLLAFA